MVSGRSSVDEHERPLWNRLFHPFNVYTEKTRREKLNPVRRGLVSSPEDWPWSSWRYY
jgi:putative transposase